MSIRNIPTDFTLAAYRSVKVSVGENTAVATASMVAVLHACDLAETLVTPDPWAEIASRYQIKIDGIHSGLVRSGIARMNLVSLYSCFDGFLKAVRQEWFDLSGREWKAVKKDGPFDEFRNNAPHGSARFDQAVEKKLQTGMEHYRAVRNAIIHPNAKTRKDSADYYLENKAQLRDLGESLGFREAPHALPDLDFHDAKCLSRLILRTAKLVSCEFDPGDSAILKSIEEKYRCVEGGLSHRRICRLKGVLRTRYGLSQGRVDRIVSDHWLSSINGLCAPLQEERNLRSC